VTPNRRLKLAGPVRSRRKGSLLAWWIPGYVHAALLLVS
jgi:hypothetical protein